MVDRNYFDHTIEGTGLHVWDLMDDHGYCYTRVGELIGWDQFWPDDEAALAVFRMFMDSPPHRAGILGSAWDVAGIGAYKGSDDKII
jgi:uncharacterized protein YkwD